jgi:hypothetical protein
VSRILGKICNEFNTRFIIELKLEDPCLKPKLCNEIISQYNYLHINEGFVISIDKRSKSYEALINYFKKLGRTNDKEPTASELFEWARDRCYTCSKCILYRSENLENSYTGCSLTPKNFQKAIEIYKSKQSSFKWLNAEHTSFSLTINKEADSERA